MATREDWESKVFEMFVAIHKSIHELENKVIELDKRVKALEAKNGSNNS